MIPFLSLDTETKPFRPGLMAPPIACIQWALQGEDREHIELGEDVEPRLAQFLEDASRGRVRVVGHNIAYDMACIWEHYPRLRPLVWKAYRSKGITDTMLRQKLIDIRNGAYRGQFDESGTWNDFGYSLADVVARFFDVELPKEDATRLHYWELRETPVDRWPSRFVEYAKNDAKWPLRLALKQEQQFEAYGYRPPTEFLDVGSFFVLHLTSVWGIRTNPERVARLEQQIEKELQGLRRDLYDHKLIRPKRVRDRKALESGAATLDTIDLQRDTKLLQSIVEERWPAELGPVPRSEKTQKVSTKKEHLEEVEHDAIEAWLRFGLLTKQGSTYVSQLRKGASRPLHTFFNIVDTGRTSSSRPNLQNQPRLPGVRECFQARPGYVFGNADFNSQEMRTFADTCFKLFGHSHLRDRFIEAPDTFCPHVEFASTAEGVDIDRAYALHAQDDPTFKDHRQHAKAANFGIPGGMGERGLIRFAKAAYGIRLSPERAQFLINNYKRTWSESEEFFQFVRMCVGGHANHGYLESPQTGFVRGGCGYTSGANFLFQHPAAVASRAALFEVGYRCYERRDSALYGSRPVNFIHDEIMLEHPESRASEAIEELAQVMADEMQSIITDVPAKAEGTLSRHWSKDAKAVYDDEGRMIPWTGDVWDQQGVH